MLRIFGRTTLEIQFKPLLRRLPAPVAHARREVGDEADDGKHRVGRRLAGGIEAGARGRGAYVVRFRPPITRCSIC